MSEALPFEYQAVSALVLAWLVRALLFGTLLAGLTWLLTRATRRSLHPAIECALWSIVLLKFVIPAGPGSSLSLASICDSLSRYAPTVAPSGGLAELDPAQAITAGAFDAPHPVALPDRQPPGWAVLLTGLYATGAAVLLVLRIRGYRTFVAHCHGLPAAGRGVRQLVAHTCRRLGLRRVPAVRISEDQAAPFVLGTFRPFLVLPRRQFVRQDELETVIVHELTHLRRGDMFVRYLQWLAGTLLFFWPVVAWVNRRIDMTREHACDAWALRHGRLTAGQYARVLLNAIQPRRLSRLAYQPACMAGTSSNIERRIDMILESPESPPRRRAWGLLALAFVLAWGTFALTGAAKDTDTDWAPTEEDVESRAAALLARLIDEHPVADLDEDGEVTRLESYPFFISVAMYNNGSIIKAYPEADLDSDGRLEFEEAYDWVRGHPLMKEVKLKGKAIYGDALKEGATEDEAKKRAKIETIEPRMAVYHVVLELREWLLDEMNTDVLPRKVVAANAKIEKLEQERKAKWAHKKGKKGMKTKSDVLAKKAQGMEHKIAELRDKAAELKDSDSVEYQEKAKKLEAKADHLEDDLVKIEAKLAKARQAEAEKN
ncbi:MAG: M48 family metalloprotease [bacterium]|nr:M48 family metalloprotease [bacterium]